LHNSYLHFINYQRTVGHRRRWSRRRQRSRWILQPPGREGCQPRRRPLHQGSGQQGHQSGSL